MARFQLARVAQPVAAATGPGTRSTRTGTTALAVEPARRPNGEDMLLAASPSSPLRSTAGPRARAAEGSHPGASPASDAACVAFEVVQDGRIYIEKPVPVRR